MMAMMTIMIILVLEWRCRRRAYIESHHQQKKPREKKIEQHDEKECEALPWRELQRGSGSYKRAQL